MAKSSTPGPTARAKGVGLLIVQTILSAAVLFWIYLQSFSAAGCGPATCGFAIYGALQTQLWVSLGALVLATAAVVVLSARARESWWIPVLGTALVLVTGIIGTVVIRMATAA